MNILKTNKLLTIKGIRKIKLRNNMLQIFSDNHVENLNQIIPVLIAQGCKIYDISAQASSLETSFSISYWALSSRLKRKECINLKPY